MLARAAPAPVEKGWQMSAIRIVAAVLMVISIVALFASDNPKAFALPLIVGNLLVLLDEMRRRRT